MRVGAPREIQAPGWPRRGKRRRWRRHYSRGRPAGHHFVGLPPPPAPLQRVRIARALAQEPKILVLDEPTAALDLHFEMETFELMRELIEERSFTVVVATHNLNLAARYASRLLLLTKGRIEALGAPDDVITADTIGRVYRWPVLVTAPEGLGPGAGAPQVVPLSPDVTTSSG